MKKITLTILVVLIAFSVFAGGAKEKNENKIVVGATPVPHAEISSSKIWQKKVTNLK